MYISVVILSFNSAKTLPKCLDSLIETLNAKNELAEIFVVENGSKDNSPAIIDDYKAQYPDLIKPIIFKENTGTTFSRNSAIKQATGKYILVLDSDAYININVLEELITNLQDNPQTGMAVPKLTYASGNFQLSCDQFPTLLQKAKRFLFLKTIEKKNEELSQLTHPIAVDYAISACWLLTKECTDATGLLDENIFYSPEDVDYCVRVWKAGFQITYVPMQEMVHDAQELSRGFKLTKFHFSHLKGLFYLFNKHKYFWSLRSLYKTMPRHK
ncbi:glycosyltransferase family 2 protein [Psychrosphaera sp. 1_MG-2023]|uniref:glycosyltransferase family 2 protein n=1 Tax=Psychrosphaera sp. 1_MG-2023 TaxID=3062643 RepID=UPI0026E2AD57|nr:glycosyltransferase family 2 protein [Psychrosphaera sp. 1_MG-2023]MDO6720366.1 glycosyltransferase family 2 protein [Psychrosphaera sp. 1_MG-2023]